MSEQIGFKPITGLNETSLNKIIEMSGKELAEKSYVDAAVSNVTVDTTNLATKSELATKVDKVEGKGLSTEDFTTEYKNKLEGLNNTGVSDEQISTAVNNYMQEHPVSSGATAEQAAQIEANKTAIGDSSSGLIKEVNDIKNTELQNLNTAILGVNETLGDKSGLPSGDTNVIASINRIDSKPSGTVTDEQINTAVNNYLTEHPITGGATAEQAAQIEANKTAIGDENSGLIKEVNDIKNNAFKDKVANFLGDSQTERNFHKTKTYHDWVKEILGLSKVNNYGVGGTTITKKSASDNTAMCVRYASMDDNADLICVMGGVNDRWFNSQMGNFGDTDPLTFYGAMETLCDGLLTKYPGKTIIFITPTEQKYSGCDAANTTGYTVTDFANAMKRVCAKYSIPVFDANTCSGIYPLNSANSTVYTSDRLHLNDKGHEVLGNKLSKFILNGANVVMINSGSSGGSTGDTYGNIVISKTTTTINEGGTDTFTVSLDKAPTNSQVVNISSNNTDVTLSTSTLTFNSSDYSRPQTVTINAAEDSDTANDNCTLTLSSNNVSSKTIAITIIDNDTPSTSETYGNIVISKSAATINEGSSDTFTVNLDKAPTNSQTVSISSDNSDVTLSTNALTFDSSNYSTAQTVTINVAEDSDTVNDNCTLTLSSNNVPSQTIAITVTDNDSPSDVPVENQFIGKTVTVTKNYNDGNYAHLTALLNVDEDMKDTSTYKIVLNGSNVSNMTNASNEGGSIFADNSGEVANGFNTGQIIGMTVFTQTVSNGNLTITTGSRTGKASSNPYVKVPILISGTVPYSFQIDEIKIIVNDVERNILKLGAFFRSDREVITVE